MAEPSDLSPNKNTILLHHIDGTQIRKMNMQSKTKQETISMETHLKALLTEALRGFYCESAPMHTLHGSKRQSSSYTSVLNLKRSPNDKI